MANFPLLKTGAAAQYGCERTVEQPTTVQRFLDGRTRRFAARRSRRSWRLRLTGLSAQEAERIGSFVAAHLETQDRFTFHDPWDGKDYEECAVPEGGYRVRAESEHSYRLDVLIEQRQV